MKFTVLQAGFLSTVQDQGRIGWQAQGVSLGGALDPFAFAVANLLVGNEPAAAGLELMSGPVRLQFADERIVAWGGGAFQCAAEGTNVLGGRAALLQAGEELLVSPAGGARAWLAIAGGIAVPEVLGSRSTDLRSGFGGLEGRALRNGDRLELGSPSAQAVRLAARLRATRVASFGAPNEWSSSSESAPRLRFVRGSDWDRFDGEVQVALTTSAFTVTPAADRMGVRLAGPELKWSAPAELVSEAVVPGTLQVPPDGQPILLLRDCQTIGGYPKIAHVITVDLPRAAQLQSGGASVRFAEISLADAQALLVARARDLERFRLGLALHLS